MQLGDDGVAAVGVHDAHEGVDAAGLVFGAGPAAAVAEVEDLAAEAVALLGRSEARRSAGTSLRACSSSDGEMYATNFS